MPEFANNDVRPSQHHVSGEIAAAAARLIVDDGLAYGAAKTKAVRALGLPVRTALPGNDEVLAAVREHIALFCADSQPRELGALRSVAQLWLQRLAEFNPLVTGAVWNGTATRHSNVHLQLFCDDCKMVDMLLLDQKIDFSVGEAPGLGAAGHANGANVPALSFVHRPQNGAERARLTEVLGEPAQVVLSVHSYGAMRGALKPAADGYALRGDARALIARMMAEAAP